MRRGARAVMGAECDVKDGLVVVSLGIHTILCYVWGRGGIMVKIEAFCKFILWEASCHSKQQDFFLSE